jgi:arylsulfatase A-like enzyme
MGMLGSAVVTAGSMVYLAKRKRPNIVWIFSDDHAYQAIGAYGGRLQGLNPTPNIDRLARSGMRFDRFYVGNSICAPSRATLLTGKHSHLHGKQTNDGGFDHNQQTFPKIMQQSGYQTAMVGKIHLRGDQQGFDYWDVLPGQGSYYQPDFVGKDGTKRVDGYVSDVITDRSLKWLDEDRDASKPFMLMIHHKAPHRSWCPAIRHLEKYDDVEIPYPETLFDDYASRTTAAHQQDMTIENTMYRNDLKIKSHAERDEMFEKMKNSDYEPWGERGAYYRMTAEQREAWDNHYDPRNQEFLDAELTGEALVKWKYQRYLKDYLRCIYGVDENIGRVMDYLAENELTDNTIIMYSSDQGFFLGEHGWFDKRFMYKESFRTPFIVSWPGVIEPGSVNTDLCQNIDWAETFLDLARAPIPEDMQGESLLPLFKGQHPTSWRNALYYHYYEYPSVHDVRRHEGVVDKRFKLIRFYGPDVPDGEEWELFDLDLDPNEMTNIYNDPIQSHRITRMKQELQRLREYYNVPPDSI